MMFTVLNKSKNLIRFSRTIRRNLSGTKNSKSISTNQHIFNNIKTLSGRSTLSLCTHANQEIELTEPIIPDSAKGDEELEHKFKVIVLEAEVLRQEGRNVPLNSFLKSHHWEELLKLETRTARKRYLDFLFKIEKKKENEVRKKEEKRSYRETVQREPPDDSHLRYHLGHNNIFLRFFDTTINNMYNNKLIQAIQFGQKLVIDCGYHNDMNSRETVNCAKQLMLLFSENRAHDDPFDLHFCNAEANTLLMKSLNRHIPSMYETSFPLNLHEKSYLDVFDKEQLVYLTPHCREELIEYDHHAVYIVGGIVDKVNNEPLSLAKAKREGIRMLKLPLDKYLQWGSGSGKSLTLNQVVSIMLDIKKTGDWKYSLSHVPRRKLIDYNDTDNLQNLNNSSYNRNNNRNQFDRNRNNVKSDFEQNYYRNNSIDRNNDRYNDNNDRNNRYNGNNDNNNRYSGNSDRNNMYSGNNNRNNRYNENYSDNGNNDGSNIYSRNNDRNSTEKKSWKPQHNKNEVKGRIGINIKSLYDE